MTIFGPDISSYEHGLNVAALTDPFVLLKCTEGTYYVDSDYNGWVAQAKAAHKIVIPYHFVKAESSAASQAAHLAAHIGDKTLPVMLDVETENTSNPTLPFVLSVADAMKAAGLRVRLVYLPHWYWQQIGSPSLAPLTDRGIGVVSSAYPRSGPLQPASGYAADGGDAGPGWAPYGGVTPVLWQFTDAGVEQQRIDFNAFRGTVDQLAALLGGAATDLGVDVTPEEHNWVNNLYSGMFYGGSSCGDKVPTGYPGAGSNSLFAHIAYLTKLLEDQNAKPAPAVDTAALAAQVVAGIEQHFTAGVDVHAVAAAVQAQLAQALSRTA